MDAYSISVTSPSRRNSSRIYQDLKKAHNPSVVEVHPERESLVRRVSQLEMAGGHQLHVCVVGAGIAGLRCADMLLRFGFRVTVLEARDRLGGRLHQERLPNGHLIDVGPNWIHGTVDNPIMELAKETRTTIGHWETAAHLFDEDGELLPGDESDECADIMWRIIKEAFEYSNKHCLEIDPDKSLLDFFQEKVVGLIPESAEDCDRKRHLVLQMAELWGAFVGSPAARQSLRFFWLEECIDGENLFCAGTYAKILERIAEPAVLGANIVYGAEVYEIQGRSIMSEGCVTVRTRGAVEQVFNFEEVVVTTPLGWLKQNLAAFKPPLPERLSRAIGNISYGCLEKVYISFPKAFWLRPDANGRKVRGFCQWLSPAYASDSNPERWTNEVVELGSLSGADAHPTLLFYIYGEESEYVTSQVRARSANKPGHDDKDAFLFDFFRPYYSRLSHFDAGDPACQPTGAFATDWLHDDLAGNGSYTNFQVGLQEGDKDLLAMRAGVPEEGVWLAGEHTAPFVALGTATGAYWSGDLVARKIAKAYRKSTGPEVAAGEKEE